MRNQKLHTTNKTGIPGVFWCSNEKVWVATLGSKRIGRFHKKSDAINARIEKQKEECYHENHGA